jgi:hypothetical protein
MTLVLSTSPVIAQTQRHCRMQYLSACLPVCSLPPAQQLLAELDAMHGLLRLPAAQEMFHAICAKQSPYLQTGSCEPQVWRFAGEGPARLHRRHTYGRFLMRWHSFCCHRLATSLCSLHHASLQHLYIRVCVLSQDHNTSYK